jgi:hypothetical protein
MSIGARARRRSRRARAATDVELLEGLIRRGYIELVANAEEPDNPRLVPTPKGTAALFDVEYPEEEP